MWLQQQGERVCGDEDENKEELWTGTEELEMVPFHPGGVLWMDELNLC